MLNTTNDFQVVLFCKFKNEEVVLLEVKQLLPGAQGVLIGLDPFLSINPLVSKSG